MDINATMRRFVFSGSGFMLLLTMVFAAPAAWSVSDDATPPGVTHRVVPVPEVAPAPGLYAAVPYTGLVVVPPAMDPKFIVPPRRGATARVIVPPPTGLVPLREKCRPGTGRFSPR
jgi:hypothetical protein